MALFGNDMFGHHMVSSAHGKSQAFGKSSASSFGSSHSSNQDPAQMGQLGNHSIFGRQKSLLNDMTHSKNDKSKPYVFSSYSYPYDFHHEGMASMFEKPLEKAKKKPELTKQQSYSVGDKPELRRAPTFSSNPKLMRSKTINPSETKPARPPRLSRSVSIADDQTSPMNMDLAIPDFHRRDAEKARRYSTSDSTPRSKKTSWPDIVKRIARKKRSSKDKARRSTASTDDSARESLGSTSSVGTNESRQSSHDLHDNERSRSDTLESKLSRASLRSRSSTSSDYDKQQEKLILSLLNNDFQSDDNVFSDRVSSTEEERYKQDHDSPAHDTSQPSLNPHKPMEEDSDPDEHQKHYSESPTLVLRRIIHLHPLEMDNMSEKSANSGRLTPKSYFSDNSDISSQTPKREIQPKSKESEHGNSREKVIMYADPGDSEHSEAYLDIPRQKQPRPNMSMTLSDRSRDSTTENKKQVQPVDDTADKPSEPDTKQRATVNHIIQNFQNLKTKSKKEEKEEDKGITNEQYNPALTQKPYVEPKVFTVTQMPRPYNTSIYSKPVILGYDKQEPIATKNGVIIQHPQPYSISYSLERVSPPLNSTFKPDLESKDTIGNDNLTADSSESGYGTSHLASSPKGYDNIKVLNFVNSLPNHSDMEEHDSETSHGELVMNGSETESNGEDDREVLEPRSDLSNVECVSGSDTETASINSDISESKLEVTKLLESPTQVCERITSEITRHSNQSSPNVSVRQQRDPTVTKATSMTETVKANNNLSHNGEKSPQTGHDITNSSNIKRDLSQTEQLHVFETEKISESTKRPEVPLEADVEVVLTKPTSIMPITHSKLYCSPDSSESLEPESKSARPLSYSSSRQYSSIPESNLTQCIDGILHLLNSLLVLCSCGVIGTGIWLLLKDFNVNHVAIILGDNLLQVIVYVSITGAGVAILAALCLCCGVKKDKYGLSFFAIVLIIVIIAFSSAAILSAIFADKLHSIEFRVNFKERLISKYGNLTETNQENKYFTASWDTMQELFECCGAEGEVSDMASWAVFKKFSTWYRKQPLKATIYVPESCCKKNMNQKVCQGSDHTLLGPPVYGPPLDEIYNQENPNLNTTGCYDFFASYLAKLTTMVAIVMGGLAGLYFLTVMLTWVFCFKKNQDYEDYLYGSFYEMEPDEHENYHTLHEIETKFSSKLINELENKPDGNENVSENINRMKSLEESPSLEETPLIIRPAETIHETLKKSSNEDKEILHEHIINKDMRPLQSSVIDTQQDDEDSDTDSENDYRIFSIRRNLWLSSEPVKARNLLSIAIEEEDSNFEDSDNETQQLANGHLS